MKKMVFSLFALMLLVSCSATPIETLTRTTTPVTKTETVTTTSGDTITTTKEKEMLVSDIKENEYNKLLDYYFQKLRSFKSYKAITSGKTSTQVLFISTDQSIEVTLIKSDYSYMINESHSSLVNTVHEVYFHNNKALYKDNNAEDFTLLSLNDYLSIYGVYPFDYALEGYLTGEGCILNITKLESEENYKFKFDFSPVLATNNVKIQMKKFGDLDDYPIFSDISIVLSLKNDFTPVSIELESHYKAKKMVETDCHQKYTVLFSNFNEEIETPNLSNIKEKLN